jgi:uncharacterized membrane protein
MGPGSPPALPAPFFRRPHLLALTLVATAYLFTSAVVPVVWVELPLGLLTLLIVPGYAIGWWALASRRRWPWSLTFALVVGWSVAVNVAIGLVLLVLHDGLPPTVFAVSSFVLIGATMVRESFRGTPSAPEPRTESELSRGLRMTGYRPAQRAVAYGLLTAIVAVLLVIVYLASAFPNSTPALAFSITGYGGTSANLPPAGQVNQTLVIVAIVQNNATAQAFVLVLLSAVVNTHPSTFTPVNWTDPLVLGNGTSASIPMNASSRQTVSEEVQFTYPQTGEYLLQFLLESPGGAVVARTGWTVIIT